MRQPAVPVVGGLWSLAWGQAILGDVSIADQLLEERRRRRRAGDPRLSEAGREIFMRITTGDLAEEFGRSLDELSAADPMLSGADDDSDD
jgi:hypothetical protein